MRSNRPYHKSPVSITLFATHPSSKEIQIATACATYDLLCAETLERALTGAPFYASWRPLDPGPSRPLAERFAALPVLTKRDVRANVPGGFIWTERSAAQGFASGEVEIVTTSGTSDERLSVTWHQEWWDRSERAAARLHPTLADIFSAPHREAVLTTPVCGNAACHVGNASMAERTLDNLLFLNQSADPTSWDDRAVKRMAAELQQFSPAVLEADPAYLGILCRMAARAGVSLLPPRCIVLTYELPSLLHQRWIARMFPGVPVVSSYGSTETGHVLTQCEAGVFHQNTATCRIDLQPFRPERGGENLARLLVTTLDNPWFTLLHFDIGDIVRLREDPCRCGRSDGLVVEGIEGRCADLTFDAQGRTITAAALDRAVGTIEALSGYQVAQGADGALSVRYSVEAGGEASAAHELRCGLLQLYGEGTDIRLRREPALPPEQSGKFRLSRSRLLPPLADLLA